MISWSIRISNGEKVKVIEYAKTRFVLQYGHRGVRITNGTSPWIHLVIANGTHLNDLKVIGVASANQTHARLKIGFSDLRDAREEQ